mmetsp:Transcript_29880/g.114712  ORF Transcript_29880/g.114712 Transcript_29880/m.114712 type:complete len:122 (-) Transcript_29880:1592-1957(-)
MQSIWFKGMKDMQVRSKLHDLGLRTHGSRQVLEDRYREYGKLRNLAARCSKKPDLKPASLVRYSREKEHGGRYVEAARILQEGGSYQKRNRARRGFFNQRTKGRGATGAIVERQPVAGLWE